jgi:hypothetical protein
MGQLSFQGAEKQGRASVGCVEERIRIAFMSVVSWKFVEETATSSLHTYSTNFQLTTLARKAGAPRGANALQVTGHLPKSDFSSS